MSRRLIDADALVKEICEGCNGEVRESCKTDPVCATCMWLVDAPTIDAVELPCKIGDFVWAIRSYKGIKHPQRGVVGEMFFTNNMKLMIVVKHVARGMWGEKIFATYEEAQAAIDSLI